MQIKTISIVVLCLLILPCATYAQSVKKPKSEKLTEAEIKEAEHIFTTFKKQLEATNDLRIALRGIPSSNWFERTVNTDVKVIEITLWVDKNFIQENSKACEQLYLNLLRFHWSGFLCDEIAHKVSRAYDPSPILNKFSKSETRAISRFTSDKWKDNYDFTKKSQIIQANSALNKATYLFNKVLKKWRTERPKAYKEGVRLFYKYRDNDSGIVECDDKCYGSSRGSSLIKKIVGSVVLLFGKEHGRIRLFSLYFS